ncbi:unnamed protein product [marine sediment metagenome]|uniref:Uncharacterized protein n=1 Tax=marine sediment metagenome TaxID=412755 RepID=X0X1A5_9ZZZZ
MESSDYVWVFIMLICVVGIIKGRSPNNPPVQAAPVNQIDPEEFANHV